MLEEAASVLLHARGDALCDGHDAGSALPPASHASTELPFPLEAVCSPSKAGAAGGAGGADPDNQTGLLATIRRVFDAVRMRGLAAGGDGVLQASRSDALLSQNPLYKVALDDSAVDEAVGDVHDSPRCAYNGWVSRGCLYRALAPLLKLNHPGVFGNATSVSGRPLRRVHSQQSASAPAHQQRARCHLLFAICSTRCARTLSCLLLRGTSWP